MSSSSSIAVNEWLCSERPLVLVLNGYLMMMLHFWTVSHSLTLLSSGQIVVFMPRYRSPPLKRNGIERQIDSQPSAVQSLAG